MSIPQELVPTRDAPAVDLPEVIKGLVNYTAKHGPERHWSNLVGLQEQLAARAFNLVVFGEFKRGKSTLINSLIGRQILPAAVVPLTSIITVVRYGHELECRVTFHNGRREHVPLRDLSAYVSESGNPENEKGVAIVEVRVPSALLGSGLFLVDTPGVGSIYQHNTDVTQRFLDQVDGALLVLAADPPISQSELNFVQEVLGRTSRVFVVLNKVDQLSPTEREEALDFTRGVLARVLPEEALEVLPVSAKLGLEAGIAGNEDAVGASGVARLSARLQRFAQDDLLPTLQKSIARRAGSVAQELKLGVDLRRRSLELSVSELQRSAKSFRRERDVILNEVNDSKILVRTAVDRVVQTSLQEDYQAARVAGLEKLKEAYAKWADEPRDVSFQDLHEELNGFIEKILRERIGEWKDEEEQGRLSSQLDDALKRFGDRVQERLQDIYAAARKHFDLPQPRIKETLVLPAKSRFEWRERSWKIQLGTGFKWHWSLLGDDRRKTALLKEGARVLTQQYDQACGRLRHDFEARLRQGAEDYMDSIMGALEQALADVDQILDQLLQQREEAASRRDEELVALSERAEFLESQLGSLEEVLGDGSPTRRRRERLVGIHAATVETVRQLDGVLMRGRAPVGTGSPLTGLDEEQSKAVMIRARKFAHRMQAFVEESAERELALHNSPQPPENTLIWANNLLNRLEQIAGDLTIEYLMGDVSREGRTDDDDAEEDAARLQELREELLELCREARAHLPDAPESEEEQE